MKNHIIIYFMILFLIPGCNKKELSDIELERKIPLMQEARLCIDQEKWLSAEKALKELLIQEPKFARPHLDLAWLYQNHITNYIHAIYHYDRYLELKPLSDSFFIKEQQSNLYKKLNILLSEQIKNNDSIKSNNYTRVLNTSNIAFESKSTITNQHRIYTVKNGDNLSKIASQFYNDASKYDVIFKANNAMKNPEDIKPGQKIIIP